VVRARLDVAGQKSAEYPSTLFPDGLQWLPRSAARSPCRKYCPEGNEETKCLLQEIVRRSNPLELDLGFAHDLVLLALKRELIRGPAQIGELVVLQVDLEGEYIQSPNVVWFASKGLDESTPSRLLPVCREVLQRQLLKGQALNGGAKSARDGRDRGWSKMRARDVVEDLLRKFVHVGHPFQVVGDGSGELTKGGRRENVDSVRSDEIWGLTKNW